MKSPFQNVTWHSRTWPCTMTPSIDQTLHQFANLLPNWTLLPILTLLPNFGGFHRTLQRMRLANRGRLLLRKPGPVPFGTCICSNVETILSWTCHVYGPFEIRTSLGTSILLGNMIPVCILNVEILHPHRIQRLMLSKGAKRLIWDDISHDFRNIFDKLLSPEWRHQ